MEKIKVLAVDPSLRNTGLALITYNNDFTPLDPNAYEISHCQTLVNPQKFKGTDAILSMLDMLQDEADKKCYIDIDFLLVESPPIMFNKNWSGGTVSSIAHIAGGAVAIFGIEKGYLFRPNEWNKNRKKDITHAATKAFLGSPENWHFEKNVRNEKFLEHILDAVSMGLWWIKANYLE